MKSAAKSAPFPRATFLSVTLLMLVSAVASAAPTPQLGCYLLYNRIGANAAVEQTDVKPITEDCVQFSIRGFATNCVSLVAGGNGQYLLKGQLRNPQGVVSDFSATPDSNFSQALTGRSLRESATLVCADR